MTGRDDKLPSVLVLAQDGRTAPLRTLLGVKLPTLTEIIPGLNIKRKDHESWF